MDTTIVELYIKISYHFEHLQFNIDLEKVKNTITNNYCVRYETFSLTPFDSFKVLALKNNVTIDSNFIYDTLHVEIKSDQIENLLNFIKGTTLIHTFSKYIMVPNVGFLILGSPELYNNNYLSTLDIKEPDRG